MCFATNSNIAILNLGKILFVLSVGYSIYRYYHKKNKNIYGYKNDFVLVGAWIFFTIACIIINLDISFRPWVKVLLLLVSFFIAKQISLNTYANVFCSIMNIIGVISIVMFLFRDLFVNYLSFLPTIKNTLGYIYITTFFANIPQSNNLNRNIGPFWEPGVYQAYLILAIVFSLFMDFKIRERIRNIIIYLIALIFTYSTTGYIAVFPLIVGYILSNKRITNIWVKSLLGLLCVVAVFVVLFNEEIFSLVFGKIVSQNASYTSRLRSVIDGITVAIKNPFFGVGAVQYENLLSGFAIVNTLIMHFAVYGFFVGIFYVYCMYRFSFGCTKNTFLALFVLLSLLLSTSGENLTYSFVFNLILFLKPSGAQSKIN